MTGPGERSEEERERARQEREAARAARAARRAGRADAALEKASTKGRRSDGGLDNPPVRSVSQDGSGNPPPAQPLRAAPGGPADPGPSRPEPRGRADPARPHRGSADPPAPPAGRRPRTPRPRRHPGRALIPLVAAVLLIGVGAAWFLSGLYQPGKGDGGDKTTVVIPKGSTLGTIATKLDGAGVISSPFFFKLRARLTGHTSDLKPGLYHLRKDMAYTDVLATLRKGVPKTVVNITIPEGRARGEIAPVVKTAGIKGDYRRASTRSRVIDLRRYHAPRRANLEGFLFPATYELKRGATVRSLVKKQLQAFQANFAKVDMSYAKRKNLTAFDVVTIASMVEREAQLDRERPLIASVIYNRLKEGIPLGIDATIRYATGNWTRPLRESELHISSGYNTRLHQGLPPGPIGNPGLASLKAAAHPARTHYLFYVVKPGKCGEHSFSSTDAQFQRDVSKYNSARAKKGGKSPTTCR